MTILLDTSVIVDVLRQRRRRHELLAGWLRQGHVLACCAINFAEVHAGMRQGEEQMTARLLNGLDYFEFGPGAARRAGDLVRDWRRRGRTLSLPDAMIGALVLEHDFALATDNKKDFPMPDLRFAPLLGA